MGQEPQQDSDFEKRTREVLEESSARLDGRALSRLTRARTAALDSRQAPRQGWRMRVPAGAAAAAVLTVVMWTGRPAGEITPIKLVASTGSADDMELLADTDAPDFVDDGEDLEFYEWAAGETES